MKRQPSAVAWLSMFAGLTLLACGSEELHSATPDSGASGYGGRSGAGGSSAMAGTGAGGAMTGTGGGATAACVKAPSDGVITDFSRTCTSRSMDGGTSQQNCFGMYGGFWGGTFAAYPDPTLTSIASGGWLFSGTVNLYAGAGIWFEPCVDASSFSGIAFTVKGDAGPSGTVELMVTQLSNTGAISGGTCTAFCQPASFVFPVTATQQTIKVPWLSFTGGKPNNSIDNPGQLDGMQYFLNPSATPYSVNLTIDDLAFYK